MAKASGTSSKKTSARKSDESKSVATRAVRNAQQITGETMNEQVKQLSELQARTFEPMRIFSNLAVETMEQVVRKNYEVMGDIVDFSVNQVKQVQLPIEADQLSDVASRQMADTKAFTELLGSRASEYVELGNEFNQKARQATEDATAAARTA